MQFHSRLKTVAAVLVVATIAGCRSAFVAPPPLAIPEAFTPIGMSAPYLTGDVIGGSRARATKMRAAKIQPLTASSSAAYMANLDAELRRQTAGIGLDVLRVGSGIVIRIPAALTFDAGSSAVKPQFDATLLEIARTVKSRNQTFVDVLAHTDTSGTAQVNQSLSDKRAAAVAAYLSTHGVARARIAAKGLGESATLYNPEVNEAQKAANRRVEIRLMPYRG